MLSRLSLHELIGKTQVSSTPTEERRWRSSTEVIQSLKSKADAKRKPWDRFADFMTAKLGSTAFLISNGLWFSGWLAINLGLVSKIKPFDPFPFSFLTMMVSLEAIFLAIFVLISQNRATRVYELREEVDLEMDTISEQEITKVLELLAKIAKKQGIDLSKDKILNEMVKPVDTERIEEVLERQVEANV